jgi:hypothetical protein
MRVSIADASLPPERLLAKEVVAMRTTFSAVCLGTLANQHAVGDDRAGYNSLVIRERVRWSFTSTFVVIREHVRWSSAPHCFRMASGGEGSSRCRSRRATS